MIKVPYEDMQFYYTTGHYDYHLSGSCIYNNKIALYKSQDETDYQTMNDTCPCCKPDGTDNWDDCHCENAPDVYCYITELPLGKRIYHRLYPYYSLFSYYIRNFGFRGIYYWRRWRG